MMHDQSAVCASAQTASKTMTPRQLSQLCLGHDSLTLPAPRKQDHLRVHIAALGDVGASLLLGLRLLGGALIDRIGIYDLDPNTILRYEAEMNQIGWPFSTHPLPEVAPVAENEIFDCDLFIFCATKAVPPLGSGGDVRMLQFEANRRIAAHYGQLAKAAGYQGLFAVVSDPVDPLCKEVLLSSGLAPAQIRGYGLGVMNKRAEYYAKKDTRFADYLTEGRAFGPHGADLVIANSIEHYDDALSRELTDLTVKSNLAIRELGFKPYLAPAFSSGAISLLLTLQGEWHYSSVYFGRGSDGAFLGLRNRLSAEQVEYEDLLLPPALYARIEHAYRNLCALI